MRNLCSLFIGSAFLLSVGCSPSSPMHATRPDVIDQSIQNETWKDKIQDRATALAEEGKLLSGAIEWFSINDNTVTLKKDSAAAYVYNLSNAVNDEYHQLLSSGSVDSDQIYVLHIERTIDGFEGEIRVVSEAVAHQINNTPVGHEFDSSYTYKVRGFFKYVALEDATYSIDQNSGQTALAMSSIAWDTQEDGVKLEIASNGNLKLTNNANGETANLGFSNESTEDDDNRLINVLTSHFPMLYPTAEKVEVSLEGAQIDPLHLVFDVTITTPSEQVAKTLEIKHDGLIEVSPHLNQPIHAPVTEVNTDYDQSIQGPVYTEQQALDAVNRMYSTTRSI